MPEDTRPIEDIVAEKILDAAFKIHRTLGPGLMEAIYMAALALELTRMELKVIREVPIPVIYEGTDLGIGYRADMLVDDVVVVEGKSVKALEDVFMKKTHTYIKLLKKRLGLVINFGQVLLKKNIKRVVNGLPE